MNDAADTGDAHGARAQTRAGFVAVAGRPNAGKSTLLNQIVGAKVAITSPRPQTTRRAIRGVATGDGWQLVVVDLPGVQRPRDPLTERMQRRMELELRESDAALFVVNGHEKIGAGDRFIAEAIKRVGVPTITVLNKIDLLGRAQTVEHLNEVAALDVQGEIFPVSAKTGAGVRKVVAALVELMPESPMLYPPDEKTDLRLEVRLAEIVREQILHRTHDEIPHAVEVQVDELEEREDGLVTVLAHAWAETESQKGILVGKGGRMVRDVGTAARKEMEALLGRRVFLDLRVRVRRGWRQDEGLLDRLGIE
jgi:GTPase